MNQNTVTCSFVLNRDLYEAYKSIVVRKNQNVKGNLIRYMQYVVEHGLPQIKAPAGSAGLPETGPNTVTCSFSMDRYLYNAYKSIVVSEGQNVKGNLVRYMQLVIQYGVPDIEEIVDLAAAQKAQPDLVTISFSVDRDLYDAYARIVQAHSWTVEESLLRYIEYVTEHGLPDCLNPETPSGAKEDPE